MLFDSLQDETSAPEIACKAMRLLGEGPGEDGSCPWHHIRVFFKCAVSEMSFCRSQVSEELSSHVRDRSGTE